MVVSGLLVLVLGLTPMICYAALLWWLDRYEKEPLGLLSVAFLWGAIPSVVLALIMQVAFDAPLTAIQDSHQLTYRLLGVSVVAPLTEEGVKVLALIALLLFLRREIDSPLDGLIYGGVIGFGFAAVENVFYLFAALTEGGVGGLVGLAFIRGGVFGLNHAMYTGFAGLGVALSLETRSHPLKFLSVLTGFGLAVTTHAMHNALVTFGGQGVAFPLLIAVAVDWLGVAALLASIVGALYLERSRIAAYGQRLAAAEAISTEEVEVLTSPVQRRLIRLELLLAGDLKRWRLMRRYHQRITEAAFTWHRISRDDPGAEPRLSQLEGEFQQLRHTLA
ncbi:MAG: PrsW family intramembrane metalloprotease [Anaerolineae bacterium]